MSAILIKVDYDNAYLVWPIKMPLNKRPSVAKRLKVRVANALQIYLSVLLAKGSRVSSNVWNCKYLELG